MKNVLLFLMCLMTMSVFSQNPAYLRLSVPDSQEYGPGEQRLSFKDPWAGAKLTMPLQDIDGNLGKNSLFSARIIYTLTENAKFGLPLATTAGLGSDDILNPASGINLGLYPYYMISSSAKSTVILHGGIHYKMLPVAEQSLTQVDIFGGLEIVLPREDGAPFSLGASFGYLENSDGIANTGVAEITGILPLSMTTGIFAEYRYFTEKEFKPTLSIGLIASGKL